MFHVGIHVDVTLEARRTYSAESRRAAIDTDDITALDSCSLAVRHAAPLTPRHLREPGLFALWPATAGLINM